jgi:hypothetical protein
MITVHSGIANGLQNFFGVSVQSPINIHAA